jgi:CheY-like chemotaxis protein
MADKTDSRRMLVIDDESVVLTSCRRIFAQEGFEVVTTESPRQGLELAAASKFDVILCDWRMPELDGLDVVELLDKRSPDSAVVMITGFPAVDRATEVMKRGAMDYIAKPFTPEEITAVVQKALKRKETERAKRGAQPFPLPSLDDQAPKTIAETVAQKVGVGKTTSPWLSVLVLGVLAGAYIGFGAMLATTTTFDLAGHLGAGFARFLSGAVFSLGLMLVVIAGAELFTGNNLMISSALSGQIGFGKMLGRWALVYAANFIGSILVSLAGLPGGVDGPGLAPDHRQDLRHLLPDHGFRGLGLRALGGQHVLHPHGPVSEGPLPPGRPGGSRCRVAELAGLPMEEPAAGDHRQHHRRGGVRGHELLERLPAPRGEPQEISRSKDG